MSVGSPSYFDPVVLAKLQNLRIRARTVAEGFLGGLHKSPFRGQSLEFAEHREYAFGDELKHIDWKVYARTDRFFVKQFEEETNLRIQILLDASGSMGYKGDLSPLSKYDYGATAAATLAYLALHQGDSAGLSLLQSKSLFIPPRASLSHLNTLSDALVKCRPEGETHLSRSLESLPHSLPRRSLVILISDLFDDFEESINSLKLLRFKKHEVIVLHLLDRAEKDFSFSGNLRFSSMEDSEHLQLETDSYRSEYSDLIAKWIDGCRASLRKMGIQYHIHTTDEPMDRLIRSVLRAH